MTTVRLCCKGNSPCSGLLESIINSYLPFDIFHFFPFSIFLWLLQLGLYIIPFTLQMESKGRPFYSDRPWQTALWYYSTSYCGCNHRISLWTVQHHLGSSCWSCRQWQIRQLRSGLCTDKMSSSSCRPVCSWQVCLLLLFFFLLLLCLSCVLFVVFQHISRGSQDIRFRINRKTCLTKYSPRTSKVALGGLYHMAGLGRIWKCFLTKEATRSSAWRVTNI